MRQQIRTLGCRAPPAPGKQMFTATRFHAWKCKNNAAKEKKKPSKTRYLIDSRLFEGLINPFQQEG